MTKGYFSKPNRLHSMADVNRVLAERTSGRGGEVVHPSAPPSVVAAPSTPAAEMPQLVWDKPVKATQMTSDGRYRLSRVETKGVMLYWAWAELKPVPKLLGYPRTPEEARALCQKHADTQT